jgi:hypothetical protein
METFQKVAFQKNLIQYMILAIPIFGDHVELIIESTLEFFNKNSPFMHNFWTDLGVIARFKESRVITEGHIGNMKSLLKNLKANNEFFCDKLEENMVAIKLKALKFVDMYITYVGQNEEVLAHLNIFSIFLLFV